MSSSTRLKSIVDAMLERAKKRPTVGTVLLYAVVMLLPSVTAFLGTLAGDQAALKKAATEAAVEVFRSHVQPEIAELREDMAWVKGRLGGNESHGRSRRRRTDGAPKPTPDESWRWSWPPWREDRPTRADEQKASHTDAADAAIFEE